MAGVASIEMVPPLCVGQVNPLPGQASRPDRAWGPRRVHAGAGRGPAQTSGRAEAGIGTGRAEAPINDASTAAAQARPSAIAHTIRL